MNPSIGRLLLCTAFMLPWFPWCTKAAAAGFGAATQTLSLLAGNADGSGQVNGTGREAHFEEPVSLAIDGQGNLYVADQWGRTVRKITPGGQVSTVAGQPGRSGNSNGPGAKATFDAPCAITSNAEGMLHVADCHNNLIRRITPAGVVSTWAGQFRSSNRVDGVGTAAQFDGPRSMALDATGNLLVLDTAIRKIAPDGTTTTLVEPTQRDVWNLALDQRGTIFLSHLPDVLPTMLDSRQTLHAISALAPGKPIQLIAQALGGNDINYRGVGGIAVDDAGSIYVAERGRNAVSKITAAGVKSTLAGGRAGKGSRDGPGDQAQFHDPRGIVVDRNGTVYVADAGNHSIRKISPRGEVSTLAGSADGSGHADGPSATARFRRLAGVAVAPSGTVYVVDYWGHKVRAILPSGMVQTLAGPEGGFSAPQDVAVDAAGHVFVADTGNAVIWRITPQGTVTAFAGQHRKSGFADGTGTAALFGQPSGLAIDSAGNLFVCDRSNQSIRKVTPSGSVSTLVGTPGSPSLSADGPAATARLSEPTRLAVDTSGHVYFTQENGAVRKLSLDGTVSTLVGSGGPRGAARVPGDDDAFYHPNGIAVDAEGNVYVADNDTIRRISATSGQVRTIIGRRHIGGFVPGPLPAGLDQAPNGLAIHGGTLYITMRHGVAVVRD